MLLWSTAGCGWPSPLVLWCWKEKSRWPVEWMWILRRVRQKLPSRNDNSKRYSFNWKDTLLAAERLARGLSELTTTPGHFCQHPHQTACNSSSRGIPQLRHVPSHAYPIHSHILRAIKTFKDSFLCRCTQSSGLMGGVSCRGGWWLVQKLTAGQTAGNK